MTDIKFPGRDEPSMATDGWVYGGTWRADAGADGFPAPESGAYTRTPITDLAVFKPDAGPEIIRRRTGRIGYNHRVVYLVHTDQLRVWDEFVRVVLKGGVKEFKWIDP